VKIINVGSLNIDYVYTLDHLARPGETIQASTLSRLPGGKGLNQSVALARAGASVAHAGAVGSDGRWLVELLREHAIETHLIREVAEPTGHAIIEVDRSGQNSIVLFGGANQCIPAAQMSSVIESCTPGDVLLTQNEVNDIGGLISKASELGIRVCLNAAPFDAGLRDLPLQQLDHLFINEIEGAGLSGRNTPAEILETLTRQLPRTRIVLTLGERGSRCRLGDEEVAVPASPVEVVDTTAAGDCYIGYYLAALTEGRPVRSCMEIASRAAAWCVGQRGAAPSIPWRQDI